MSEKGELAARVDLALDAIRPYLESHLGGVEVDDVDDEGNVKVRFTGACVGCPGQGVTYAATVAPIVELVRGVKSAQAGGRISEYATRRIRKYLAPSWDRYSRTE
jgi:Fe-S cluster biogenesis protein NfuA